MPRYLMYWTRRPTTGPNRQTRRGIAALLASLAAALLLAACDFSTPSPAALPTTPADQAPPAENEPTAEPLSTGGARRQLVLWLPEFFNPADDTNAGAVLEGAFFQFEQSNPGLSLDVQIKAESGQIGLLSYLRAAQRVAPTILPDLVLVHSSQLWQITDLGIIPALESHEVPASDLYFPFTVDAVTYRGQLYGFPYAANILHGVMHSESTRLPAATTQPESADAGASAGEDEDEEEEADASPTPTPAPSSPSATWDDLLTGQQVYVFPAGAIEGSRLDSAVMHFLAAGGTLSEEGAPAVDADALETYFEFLVLARRNNIVPPWLIDYADYETLWNDFSAGAGDLALMSAQNLLHDADSTRYIFLPVPTATGENASIGNVWAFAILTRDEGRRALALDLINSLLAPEIQGAWSQAALRVPTQIEALERWGGQSDYLDFLQTQMENAQAVPAGRPFADFARRLHAAQAGLMQSELTVEEAILQVRSAE